MSDLPEPTFEHLRAVLGEPRGFAERFEVVGELGRGGMGVVYRCRDLELGRDVALKVVLDPNLDSGLADRLRQEATVLAGLEHPSVVPVHDAGHTDDGRPYYIMKFVDGERLGDWAAHRPDLFDRLAVMLRVAEAVAYAHDRGVLHRDLKPDNVMVASFGSVFVLDWGLAKSLARTDETDGVSRESAASDQYTEHGTVLGTPTWMAPEQARGRTDEIDERADVYGLGGLLYFLLTDRPPGAPLDELGQGRAPEAPRRVDPTVPKPLEAICMKALATDPAARYRSAEDLRRDLRNYIAHDPVAARPEGPLERVWRIATKHRALLLLVGAYLLARVGIFLWQAIREP